KWGLDYEDVRRLRAYVVYVASQGFGRGGPLGEASAYGPLNSAFAGVTWLWNHPDAPYPAGSSLNHPDHIAAKLAAVAVLAALEHGPPPAGGHPLRRPKRKAPPTLTAGSSLEGPPTEPPPARWATAPLSAGRHAV